MNIRHTLIAGIAALGLSVGAATVGEAAHAAPVKPAAPAAPAATYAYGAYDVYGAFVSTPTGVRTSARATSVSLNWNSNRQYVTVAGNLLDTGRGDGKLAGLFAQLYYSDGSSSDWKLVGSSGNETSLTFVSRQFVPGKITTHIRLVACQANSAGAIVGGCGAVSGWYRNVY